MAFAEKLKQARAKMGLTQMELSRQTGISHRAIQTWESGQKYPKSLESVMKLANVLNTTTEELLSDSADQYIIDAHEKGGAKAAADVEKMVNDMKALFAGGNGAPELDEEEKDGIIAALNEAYWEAKKRNKKYTPKKYQNEVEQTSAEQTSAEQ